MKRPCSPICAPVVLCACVSASLQLYARDDVAEPSTNLPPIIVQASRANLTADTMPSHVQIITAQDIAKSGQRNIVEVLQKQAGLLVRELSGNPSNAQISMRGFGANSFGRVLILVDGERLNNPDMMAPNLLRIPIQSIQRIEILHGSQTVLYGDFASAGMINIITAEPTAEPVTTVGGSVGSYDTFTAYLNKRGLFEDGVSYQAHADWNRSDGYRENSAFETYDLSAHLAKQWNELRSLSLSTFYHNSTYGLPGSLDRETFTESPRRSTTPQDETEIQSWGMNLGGSSEAGEDGQFAANITASRREIDSAFFGENYHSALTSEINSYALTPRYILTRTLAGHENRLTLGSDLRFDSSSSTLKGLSYGTPYSNIWDYDRTTWAGYAQNALSITETLTFSTGIRYERFFNRITGPQQTDSASHGEAAYEAALLYQPQAFVKLFARAAHFYRAPFVDEVVGWGGIPNMNLNPETGLSLETGTEVTLAKEWTLSLTAYQMETADEIYYHLDAMGMGSNINAPYDTRRQGAESALRWQRDSVGSVALSYNYVQAEFIEGPYDNNTFPLVPLHTLSLNSEAYITPEVAILGGIRTVSSQYLDTDFVNAEEQLKAYGLLDLAVRYEPSYLKGLRLLAGADNVLDKRYASYAGTSTWSGPYYYPANGRTWKLCASYTF